MLPPDLKTLADGLIEVVRGAVGALASRLDAVELRLAQVPAGRDGRDGAPGAKGEAGSDGRDGVDGLGFEDFDMAYDGERTYTFQWRCGERVKTFKARGPFVIDRGVYRPGTPYERGDAVTHGGSLWIAQKDDPTGKPGESEDWRLAVKKGRDGRDGEKGERGAAGERGLPGLDGRRLQ